MTSRYLSTSLALLAWAGVAGAQQAPSYAKQVRPFLARYCVECHGGDRPKGDLGLDSFKALAQGGKSGEVVVPGKPDESPLVLQVEGKQKPEMPPKKSRQPRPNEAAILRAWVAAGAKDDTADVARIIPDIKPRVPAPAPVTALAYRSDGKVLAAGSYRDVLLIDPASGDVTAQLTLPTKVTAMAFSPDGRRLAVAAGAPCTLGEVRLYGTSEAGIPAQPERTFAAHADLIHAIAFSPDGKLLATGGYDRLIKLWDVATGKELRPLKDHSDAVYALAFSPDGKLLASGAADRAVKVWDVATGARLYTLGESTDWVYATAWSPDGRHVAGAGVDRSIRVWEVNRAEGRIVQSVFAHEGAVTRLVYSADGKTLYSLGEDRTVKAWDAARMVEKKVYERQPDATLALAVAGVKPQVALGRYDGALVLLDEKTGKTLAQPLPAKPKPPELTSISPASGRRGQTVRVTFAGKRLDQVGEVVAGAPGVTARLIPSARTPGSVQADITFPATAAAGAYPLRLKSPAGESASQPFTVDLFPAAAEKEQNDSPSTGQFLALPATVVGSVQQGGDVDFYRFEAKAGQEIGVQVLTSAVGSKLEPVLQLTDTAGRVLAESSRGFLGHVCDKAGWYSLGIRDREYRGSGEMHYRLHVGDVPVITSLFPLGIQRGTESAVHVEGVHLGPNRSVRINVPADAAVGSRVPVPVAPPGGTPLGDASVAVGEFAESVLEGKAGAIATPGTGNGRIAQAGATQSWQFQARKGERLLVEVHARRLGSPLDSTIEVRDASGRPVPRATLRSVAKTYVTFRDHDSNAPGIRLEHWNELAINDFLFVGTELMRIHALPKNPDDDCQFYTRSGQRTAFLETTPTHHPMGEPMYKVTTHPPGTAFPSNGFPVFQVDYRNDDGGPGVGKDSRLFFEPPADGTYTVRVGDARGMAGSDYAYRLTVRPPRPGFNITFSPTEPAVWKGGALPIAVTADRQDGYEGPIEVRLENLPPGFHAPVTTIPPGQESTAFALYADAGAKVADKAPPLKLVARATIDGKEVRREARGGQAKAVDPGQIVTVTDESEVTVQPGQQVRLTARIERRDGFKGRVPVEVRGLPHGVRVLDIGLNGILITEQEKQRTFAIYCDPWVQPQEHPIVVLAKHEGKNTEHAAKSVLLKVAAPSK